MAKNMYSSERAHEVGDLVTVIIDESTSLNKSQSKSTSKEASADVAKPDIGTSNQWLDSGLEKVSPASLSGSSEYTGSGSKSDEASFTTQFTARVVDVLPNSNLLIRGEREVMLDGEKLKMTMGGLVRPRDIGSGNRVRSSQIADARIRYKSKGDLSRGSKPGWLWNLFQWVNPF